MYISIGWSGIIGFWGGVWGLWRNSISGLVFKLSMLVVVAVRRRCWMNHHALVRKAVEKTPIGIPTARPIRMVCKVLVDLGAGANVFVFDKLVTAVGNGFDELRFDEVSESES